MTVAPYLVASSRDARNLGGRVDHAGRVVRVGKEEGPDAGREGRFQAVEIEAGAIGVIEVVEPHRHDLGTEELDQLAIGEVVGPDDGDAVARGDGGADARGTARPACPA